MQWYENPAIQSAAAPLLLALIFLVVLRRIRTWSEPVTVLASFLMTTYLIMGISFQPLTSTRKVVLLALLFFILAVVVQNLKIKKNLLLALVAATGIVAACWVIWPWISRQEWTLIISVAVGITAFIIANCAGLTKAATQRKKFLAVAGIFALSSSFASIVGATASLGQMSMALAMPFFVAFALDWFKPVPNADMQPLFIVFCVPASILAINSVVFAQVPWYVLFSLSLIPLSAFFTLPKSVDNRYKLLAEIIISAVPGVLAILLTWNSEGSVPL